MNKSTLVKTQIIVALLVFECFAFSYESNVCKNIHILLQFSCRYAHDQESSCEYVKSEKNIYSSRLSNQLSFS